MTVLFSDDHPQLDWSEARRLGDTYGVKGGRALALPREWTPSFALLSADVIAQVSPDTPLSSVIGTESLGRIRDIASPSSSLIVRSSVVGESIWERGTYCSVEISSDSEGFSARLDAAALDVIKSAPLRTSGMMIQRYISPASQGEFGNLQRVSKTRDQWEISATDRSGAVSNTGHNSQRDAAADPKRPITVRAGISRERLFGSIGAWLNNELLRGKSQRLTCEWVTDNKQYYLVQIDEEDEDLWGENPFQLRILPSPDIIATESTYLKLAQGAALQKWDKLKVLNELWEEGAAHKPTLFYVCLADLPSPGDAAGVERLEKDFADLFGDRGIVVRTSVSTTGEKVTNLWRTECETPASAAKWCVEKAELLSQENDASQLAFIAHRFVAARAAAWVRADPDNPIVEIHSLWGLPDALQYCPHDTWEVHMPTQVATDYPEYKPEMLIAGDDGGWRRARVKNEVARANSIGSPEAKEIATRSLAIAERMGHACHIMWFVNCIDKSEESFSMPWYWTKAHEAEGNSDRSTYSVFTVTNDETLSKFKKLPVGKNRLAIGLQPEDLDLMRDNKFIARVGQAAKDSDVPVILSGSTLAHAYYQLRLAGCAVVTPTRKERSRIRRTANLGKLVRDKIPNKIAARQEFEITKQVPASLIKGFLISKLLEEALEVREAVNAEQKREELADLYEVIRALAKSDGYGMAEIESAANGKREKAGGFEQGLVLLQTGITTGERNGQVESKRLLGQVLADQTADDTVELPFSFFGFMEIDEPRSILFEHFGIRIDFTLRPDRIEIRVVRSSEQLALELDAPLPPDPE